MVVNSPGQWMAAAAGAMALAVPVGLAVGQYAINAPIAARSGFEDSPPSVDSTPLAPPTDDADLRGPDVVRCTGCAPTLAERQAAADMAGMDLDGMVSGPADPVVIDYQSQEAPWGEDDGQDRQQERASSPVYRLPDNVDRFARGEAMGQMGRRLEGARVATAFQP
ncbi:hypothetical protein [Sphingobium fontiphilum]|uniref:hypothetical protein n=1 Tax=Sphingobium fontiphilum TaxID=944425 RepID=UPI0016135015|nr:hypothetical protein [Sphingobium fontiphilum]